MSVNDASALEETLARLRQRYTLYFNLPDGVRPGEERNVEVALTASASRRHPDAEVHYRRVSMSSTSGGTPAPMRVTHASPGSAPEPEVQSQPARHRRVAVNQDGSAITGTTADDDTPSPAPLKPSPDGQTSSTPPSSPGWRKVDPNRQQ